MSVCLDCGAGTADGITLCDVHDDQVARLVGAAPGLLAELEVTRVRQSRLRGTGGRRAAVRPLPWDDRASLAQRALADQLTLWARYLGATGTDGTDPAAAAAWLYGHSGAVRSSQAAAVMLHALRRACVRAQRAVDRPDPTVFAGPCWACGAPLYASPGALVAICRACREPHDVAKLREHLLRAAEDLLGTATECAAMLTAWAGIPVSVDAVHGYVRRGELLPRGHVVVEGRAVARYRFGDVLDLARRAARRRPAQPRRPQVPGQTPPRGFPTPA